MAMTVISREAWALGQITSKWFMIVWPYLVAAILIVSALELFGLDQKVVSLLAHRPRLAFPGALLLGMSSPL